MASDKDITNDAVWERAARTSQGSGAERLSAVAAQAASSLAEALKRSNAAADEQAQAFNVSPNKNFLYRRVD